MLRFIQMWVQRAGLLGFVLYAGACSRSGPIQPVVRFSDADLRDRVEVIELSLVRTCPADPAEPLPSDTVLQQVLLQDEEGAPFETVDAGDYGLHALARDIDCRVIAAGCETVEVTEDGGRVSVVLAPADGAACENCDSGFAVSARRHLPFFVAGPVSMC